MTSADVGAKPSSASSSCPSYATVTRGNTAIGDIAHPDIVRLAASLNVFLLHEIVLNVLRGALVIPW